MKKKIRPPVLLIACITVVATALVGVQTGRWFWAGDLLALVLDYMLLVLLVLMLVVARRRAWRWVAVFTLLAVFSGWRLFDYPRAAVAPAGAGRTMRLMVYNIYYRNLEPQQVVAEVARNDPDVVFLMEYSDAIQREIEPAFTSYPYRLIQPSRLTMGLALFSKFPLEQAEVRRFEQTRIPIYDLRLVVDGKPVALVAGHPWPPQPQWGQLHRNQLGDIVKVAAASPHPLIVIGDFNAAPWSAMLRTLSNEAQVASIRQPVDLSKTFGLPPWFGLPLDHVLVSDEWQVLEYEYDQPGGSDHAPLIVDLHLR